jgi:pre-mRNA-splicing factor CWC22
VIKELDLVEDEDQYTHFLSLDDEDLDGEEILNVFREDKEYLENEEKYKTLKREILGETEDEDSGSEASGSGDSSGDESDEDDEEESEEKKTEIVDNTETNLVALRRLIYLTIQSSLDFEECAHKLKKLNLKPGQEVELCHMILDCCAQQRTYEKFFGLLAQRFCELNKMYVEPFQNMFGECYETCHRSVVRF